MYSGRQVTIKLKKYNWSNGQPVTAQNVLFWINMQLGLASNANEYGGTVAGDFPFNVTNLRAVGDRRGDDDDEQALLGGVVHRQRAEPDHAHARGMGPDLRQCDQ